MYDKIMVPLDGSELSEIAIAHAAVLSRMGGGDIVLVQVIDAVSHIVAQATPATIEPLPGGAITTTIAEEAVGAQRRQAQANLDAVQARIEAEGAGGAITTVIVEGSPGPALEQALADQGCDIVVMATHGRSGFKRAILGSVADHLVRNSPGASVLLVEASDAV